MTDNVISDRPASDRYDYLFERTVEAAKPALAVVIIYAIAYYMGWEKAYWATVSAFSVNLMCQGMTLYRGVIRVMGTLLGGFTGLALIALFPQERWAYQTAAMVPIFLFAYGCTGKNDYLYVVAGITFSVVMGVTWQISDWQSGESHQIVMLRVTQTWMGSLVMVLISVYLWPITSIGKFENLTRQIWTNHQSLFGAVRQAMSGADVTEDAQRMRLKDVDLQEEVHFVLHLAENDSFEMIESGHDWHEFLHESVVQVENLESLRESLSDLQGLDLSKVLPNLDDLCSELERRYEQTGRMLATRPPTVMPQSVALQLDQAEFDALPAFQQAAVSSVKSRLEDIEAISLELFNCVAKIRMFEQSDADHDAHAGHGAHGAHAAHGPWLALDIERVRFALGIMASVWIGFLCWVYIYDVPITSIFWAMCGVMAFVITYRGEMTAWTLCWSWTIGTALAFICNVFIFQHLHGYHEFAILIFTISFLLGFIFYPMAHPGGRMFTLISFTIIVQADNEQIYSLQSELGFVLWIWLTILIPIVGKCLFTPWRPEKMFLRLFDRFFRQAHLLISAHGPDGPRRQGFWRRQLMAFYQNDLSDLPRKCALYASPYDSFKLIPNSKTIDYETVGTPPEKVQELLISLYLLSYRVKDLLAARTLPRMDEVESELLQGKQEWMELTGEWFRLRAADPERAIELTGDMPERLAELEPHIDQAFARVDQSGLSAEDRENFYILLTSYRRLSEAMVNHARIAADFDWPRWREVRF
ncbi:MAG: FUSC family protein [Alphaproteobacteria bacterium]|nr:FUSC family protein [Alphaproteobacteria bacterium]